MHSFAIITNAYKDRNLDFTNKIVQYIKEKGGTAVALSARMEDVTDYERIDFSIMPEDTECILVLGGDGTLIRTATKVMEYQIPVIGVNLGTLGYLCEIEAHKNTQDKNVLEADAVFDAINHLMADEYHLEERIMLEGRKVEHLYSPEVFSWKESSTKVNSLSATSIKEEVLSTDKIDWNVCRGLNDIVIHRVGDLSVLNLKVYVNGRFLASYNADGIIVSTPTGSTGYNLSAGGPIINPTAPVMVMTPINPHGLNSRSIIFSPDDCIEIEMGTRRFQRDETANVSCDGDRVDTLCVGERFQIFRSQNVVSFVRINQMSFLEILRKKMLPVQS